MTRSQPAGEHTSAPVSRDDIERAAELLRKAADLRVACPPVRTLLADASVPDAYEVQRAVVAERLLDGDTIAGWKIGLTSPAVQQQLGVDQPDFGALLATTEVADGDLVALDRLIQPKVEAEVAFVLGHDLVGSGIDDEDIRRATAYVVPALEIVDSRIRDWDITIVDTVADNASSGRYVLGATRSAIARFDFEGLRMDLTENGTTVSSGRGADCLGSPLKAVGWLANTLHALGQPLRRGDVVLSGALGPMVAAAPGATYEAHLSTLGPVSVRFSDGAGR